ncbi:zinc finger protein 3 homolog isoform X7 [Leptopilina boulardi]|uniref:zinc finger protein 3 homolog isoform X7 n=1 Tax=Leptopilina boulardi TaxID=63433 RepID=UPI0021F51C16|nr:zinc finger protein 3 homolog isoform X7 [Leptopilina boulardi]
MSSLDYLDLCRLCLVKDRVGISIFEDEGDARQVFLKIASCLPVKVSREDKLPKKICDDCMYKLELFYQFWNTTANAEKQLLQWLDDVDMQDKQGYVTEVLNPSLMKQEQQASENRLDENVLQVGTHQNNMGMGMMDNMGLGMPIIISTTNQPMTSVSMDTSGSSVQTIQAVPGTSTQSTHDQISQNQVTNVHHNVDEDSDDDEENESDDECDADDGLPVKEENEDDPNNRTVEPTTFVNVSLPCDEAGPSGLQQQKITEMPEMAMPQIANADNKTGSGNGMKKFTLRNPSILKKTWNMVKIKDSYYAYCPADKILKEVINTMQNQIEEIVHDLNYEDDNISNSESEKEEKEEPEEVEQQFEEIEQEEIEQQFEEVEQDEIDQQFEEVEQYEEEQEQSGIELIENEFLVKQDGKPFFKESLNEAIILPANEYLDENEYFEVNDYLEVNENNEILNTNSIDKIKKNRRNKSKKSNEKIQRPIHSCTECSFTCARAKFMRLHLLREHNISNRKFKCPECELSFDQNCILKAHYTRKHTNESPFTCSYCGKQYKVKGDLSNHVRLYHEEKSLVCDICGKSCSNSNSLYTHKKRIHYTPNYKCLICKRSMVTQENLDRHMLTQHSRFVCEECGKTFSTKVILQRHIQSVHNNIKLHACEFCSRRFSRQSHLRQHLLIHTGKRLFACDLCDKTFTQKPGLISHRKLHPGDHPPLPTFRLDDILSELIPK